MDKLIEFEKENTNKNDPGHYFAYIRAADEQ